MVNQQGRTVGPDFIAGLVVGEGSFVLGVHKHRGDKIRIKPAFYMQMNDGVTMETVYYALKAENIGVHLHHRPDRWCWTLQVAGFRRMRTFINFLYPHLTGTKQKAAGIVLLFINSRLEAPAGSPYTEYERDLVRQLRATNGNQNGKKNPL